MLFFACPPCPMPHPLHCSPSRAAALLIALASVASLAPAQAGPAQRLAARRGISVREARAIINRPMVAGPAAPDAPAGGSVYLPNYSGPAVVVGQ